MNEQAYKLIDKETGKEIKPGDKVKTFRGDEKTVSDFRLIGHGEGRVYFHEGGEYYPSVIGAVIVPVEKQQAPDSSPGTVNEKAAICGTAAAWLITNLESHEICDSVMLADMFRGDTGIALKNRWPEYSRRQVIAAIQARGLGGSLQKDAQGPFCHGWEVAEAIASELCDYERNRRVEGWGSRYQSAIQALKVAGGIA